MIFKILLEDMPSISDDMIDKWSTASDKVRGEMITEIIRGYGVNDENPNWRNAFRSSCYTFGIDPDLNPFIQFFDEFSVKRDVYADDKLLSALVEMVEKGEVVMDDGNYPEWLFDKTLYDRSLNDFVYTAKLFEIVHDPSKISKYFHDVEKITPESLYVDNDTSKGIKPAGSIETRDDTTTLFGTVESWSGEDGANNKAPETRTVKNGKGVSIKVPKLTRQELNRIKSNSSTHVRVLDQASDELKKDGTVVFADYATHKSKEVNLDDWVNSFYVWQNGQWHRFEP